MRECFTYGSVRGAARKGRPYRDRSVGWVELRETHHSLTNNIGGSRQTPPTQRVVNPQFLATAAPSPQPQILKTLL